ncbi:MAG: hypothetical protein ACREB7_13620 [Sphingopyxis sp.]|jgi:hypothetical protein|uniref:hypothetical protein n=1 Tax=Sphingopyxis sp. TaxID=1908224 RepID=UPI003D6D72EA
MNDFDPELRIDIRDRLRAHGSRQLVIARMQAPADWEGALRHEIAQHRRPQPLIVGSSDFKLFLQSFLIFFTATMMFLI